jgi:hypothetical protein
MGRSSRIDAGLTRGRALYRPNPDANQFETQRNRMKPDDTPSPRLSSQNRTIRHQPKRIGTISSQLVMRGSGVRIPSSAPRSTSANAHFDRVARPRKRGLDAILTPICPYSGRNDTRIGSRGVFAARPARPTALSSRALENVAKREARRGLADLERGNVGSPWATGPGRPPSRSRVPGPH